MRVRAFLFLLAAISAATPALAGTVTGLVTDATGAVVPNATIVLREVATGRELTVQTAQDGRYSIEAPSAGRYLLRVSRTGFAPTARTVIVEDAAQRVELSLTLALASVREEVTVTAARAGVVRRGAPGPGRGPPQPRGGAHTCPIGVPDGGLSGCNQPATRY